MHSRGCPGEALLITTAVSTTCAQGGVRGVVTDADTGAGLAGAEVEVEDRADKRVTSSARGEYWRLLLPGTYTLRSATF